MDKLAWLFPYLVRALVVVASAFVDSEEARAALLATAVAIPSSGPK